MSFKPKIFKQGQHIITIPSPKGDVLIRTRRVEDFDDVKNLINEMVEWDYIYDNMLLKDSDSAKKYLKKAIKSLEEGSLTLIGFLNNEPILVTGLKIKKIKSGKFKGEYFGEVGIMIKNNYRNLGIGGKLMDFYIKHSKEIGLAYLYGEFFSENFYSLVLCKSRKLGIYRIEKEKIEKWNKKFDKVKARIWLNAPKKD